MRKLLYILAALCLCACGENKEEKEAQRVPIKQDDAIYVLGVEMGGRYETTKLKLEEQVNSHFVEEVLIINNQKVGPTTFDEIRFDFGSFLHETSLYHISLSAYLTKEEARSFSYFWDKEFTDKYGCKLRCWETNGVEGFASYGGEEMIVGLSVDEDNSYLNLNEGYKCRINYWCNELRFKPDKVFYEHDKSWYMEYLENSAKNRHTFMNY
jgi:hypothetical protein